ncbi:Type I restriction endonuclease subunit M [Candidatus Ornithobacterium hominis]|uniref:hypothetical protein n=1 Tax=Candidatus Ornithobacterium hominis TaxID=2497989 RepID=UPI0024BC5D88|nr:hypothetical protein [Candidatus Ornithobacterium hominis]CAI9429250.1 Type I restriction endonuclease subunit M [Candidatus Ornithobacterium hominis]
MESISIYQGKELFKKLSKRDYSGSGEDKYAQLLITLHFSLVLFGREKQFYKLLEKAVKENKKIIVVDNSVDEYTIDSLALA